MPGNTADTEFELLGLFNHLILNPRSSYGTLLHSESPLLAVSRSPASASKRQLWRKLPLRVEISEAIYDPTETLSTIDFGAFFSECKIEPRVA